MSRIWIFGYSFITLGYIILDGDKETHPIFLLDVDVVFIVVIGPLCTIDDDACVVLDQYFMHKVEKSYKHTANDTQNP